MVKEEFINWNIMSKTDRLDIIDKMEKKINNKGILVSEVFSCSNVNCTDKCHRDKTESIFTDLKSIMLDSTSEFSFTKKKKRFKVIPGWNDNVRELHLAARNAFILWQEKGRPLDGILCDDMKSSRSLFKAALHKCKINENLIRKKKLLENLKNKNFDAFWKEVRLTNNTNNSYPDRMDGIDDPVKICEKFSAKYKLVLQKSKDKTESFSRIHISEKEKQSLILRLSITDIKRAVKCLNTGIGFDGIHSNHLKLQSDLVYETIAMLFYSFIIHSYLPDSMIRGIITPIVKDKMSNLSESDNYRPVMSSSNFLKLFEYCLLYRIETFICLNDRQHGYRKRYSTSSACLVLKETVFSYLNGGSDVYSCFIDIKKAFDSVDHIILMDKLVNCGVPSIYVNLIAYWYGNQYVSVRYMSEYSSEWKIGNGVRQGGILSGLFFSLYIDQLLNDLTNMSVGCNYGILKSNIIAYADDIVILAPTSESLKILIKSVNKRAQQIKFRF